MLEEKLNDMDALEQCDWDDVEEVIDMEGELRSALADLDDYKDKYKKVVDKYSYLRGFLDKGKKVIDECETKLDEKKKECSKLEVMNLKRELKDDKYQISNGLNLKGGNEIRESVL